MSTLERRHYRLLRALALHGRVVQAALSLGLTQPAASHQLREAERRLGVRLVARSGRTLTLTPAAQRLVQAASEGEALFAAAEADAQWLDGGSTHRLRLALDGYDRLPWLVEATEALSARRPGWDLELVRCASGEGVARVVERSADIAIATAERTTSGLVELPLFRDPLVAVSAPSLDWPDAVTAETVCKERYLAHGYTPERGFEYEHFFRPAALYPKQIQRIESLGAILTLVAAGHGVSIQPLWTVVDETGLRVSELSPPAPPLAWSLYRRRDEELSRVEAMELVSSVVCGFVGR